MALADAVKGARHYSQTITWTDGDGDPRDLSGATLSGFIRPQEGEGTPGEARAIDGALAFVADGSDGQFTWTYGTGDVSEAGEFEVQFVATFGSEDEAATLLARWTVHERLGI